MANFEEQNKIGRIGELTVMNKLQADRHTIDVGSNPAYKYASTDILITDPASGIELARAEVKTEMGTLNRPANRANPLWATLAPYIGAVGDPYWGTGNAYIEIVQTLPDGGTTEGYYSRLLKNKENERRLGLNYRRSFFFCAPPGLHTIKRKITPDEKVIYVPTVGMPVIEIPDENQIAQIEQIKGGLRPVRNKEDGRIYGQLLPYAALWQPPKEPTTEYPIPTSNGTGARLRVDRERTFEVEYYKDKGLI